MTTAQKLTSKSSRSASIVRNTKETQINMELDLDRPGSVTIKTSLPFLSHMLDTLACHGRFSLTVDATGDIEVDPHHLIEDVGIVLGECIFKALGGLTGIQRAGTFTFPMDGSLVNVSIDICGRRNLVWHTQFGNLPIGTLDPNLFREFFKGLVDGSRATLHINRMYGDNDHHVIEATFKALARALRQAITPLDGVQYLSTKGMLDEN